MQIDYENLAKLNEPYFEEYQTVFRNVLESGWFILGQNVSRFEDDFAKYLNVSYCIGVASGLDALILSIKALDLEPNSEIIVPSNTYIATILAILQCGYKPVLVEPDIRTYNIDPTLIAQSISPRTRAVLIVHLYGKPCDMDSITRICEQNNLFLIEDCAQAHGAEYKGKRVGAFGQLAAFSFYPTKNLGCLGDGGAITTGHMNYDEKVRMFRNYGSKVKYYNECIGFNSRLDEVQAAFLSVKLKHLDSINNHKRKLAAIYRENLNTNYVLPIETSDTNDVYHIFNVRHPKRDQLKEYLLKSGIKTEIHYPVSPNKQKALGHLLLGDFPISEEIHRTTLSLPISSFHSESEIYRVVEVMNKF